MRRKDLHIATPCHESWDAMDGAHATRFCGQCDKHVHDLSAMTQREADALLHSNQRLCVRYTSTQDGEVLHTDSQDPTWRLSLQATGAQRLTMAALMALPLALSACLPDAPSSAQAVSPLILEDGEAVKVGVSSVPPAHTEEQKEEECDPEPELDHIVAMGEPPMVEPTKETIDPTPIKKKKKKKDILVKPPTKHDIIMGRMPVKVKVEL